MRQTIFRIVQTRETMSSRVRSRGTPGSGLTFRMNAGKLKLRGASAARYTGYCMERLVGLLKHVWHFRHLKAEDLQRIVSAGHLRRFS